MACTSCLIAIPGKKMAIPDMKVFQASKFARKIKRKIDRHLDFRRHPFLSLPGMIGYEERMNLFLTCQRELTGNGVAIEFGAFLGASTAAIQNGLRSRHNLLAHSEFHVVDCFKTPANGPFSKYVWEHARAGRVEHLLSESNNWLCFYEAFMANVNSSDPNIIFHRCFVADFTWEPKPVEFLHLDLPKDWDQASYIISKVFPYLVLDAKILFQDFCYQWSAELIGLIGHLINMGHILPYRITDTTLSCSIVKQFSSGSIERLRNLMNTSSGVLSGIEFARQKCGDLLTRASDLTLLLAKAQHLYANNQVSECFQIISSIVISFTDDEGSGLLDRLAEMFQCNFIMEKSYEMIDQNEL